MRTEFAFGPPTPTEKDAKLIRLTADRVWEWAKLIEDPRTQDEMKIIATEMHALASRKDNE